MMKPLNIKNKIVKHKPRLIGGIQVSGETVIPIDNFEKPAYVLSFGSSYSIELNKVTLLKLQLLLDEMELSGDDY